ncbi:MAG TPA: (d)CMP kinase [Clostridiaceae bacterium]|nr:(d)CMP kinase [Clostridiaceae bacterium]
MISIAIDGPAGAGKSTVAKAISKKLGIIYLDTGAMYRTVALKAIKENVDSLDREKLSNIVKNINMEIRFIDNQQHMFLDNEDVTEKIRTPEVSIGASNVGTIPEVRLKMAELQRKFAEKHNVVMEGRDIGSFVLPNATLKIFLTATLEKRAERRYKELIEKGTTGISMEDVKRDIEYRDKNDSSRSLAPLIKAPDAIEIETTNLTVEEVVDKIIYNMSQRIASFK